MKKVPRREFIRNASFAAIAASAGLAAGCGSEQNHSSHSVITGKKFEWKMVTAWPPHFPLLGEYAEQLAVWIDKMSNGKLKIQVYGGGELVPPFEAFDAVSQGIAEMGHTAAYYWSGKVPAAQFFASVPFGMNTQQVNAWIYHGGGQQLWDEVYAPFNLIAMPAGNTGGQMGGWFKKEINSVSDIRGLKWRMAGLGGKVITKAGATSILSPAGELYTNLERGVIDALEWVGPYHDYLMGFQDIAKYYYHPSWQEPTAILELMINKSAFNQLDEELQNIVRYAAAAANVMMLSGFESKNGEYYKKIKDEGEVEFRQFPDDVMRLFKEKADEVFMELMASDAMSKKVYESYVKFRKSVSDWNDLTERFYFDF